MTTYLDVIALGHLSPCIKEHALDDDFFLHCKWEELQDIGIAQLQWKKIKMYMQLCHSDKPAVGGDAAAG